MRRLVLLVLLPVLVCGVGLAACSSGGDDDDAQDVSGVEERTDDDGTGNGDDEDDNGDGDADEFCRRVRQAETDADADAADPATDPEPLATATAQIESMREVAPNQEIDDALAVYGEMFTKLDALELPTDASSLMENPADAVFAAPFVELVEIMFDPALASAAVTLTTYFTEECGVDLAPMDLGGAGMPGLDPGSIEGLNLEDLGLGELDPDQLAEMFDQSG